MSALTIRVTGTPAPQGSKTKSRHGLYDDNAKTLKPWRQAVHDAALGAMANYYDGGTWPTAHGPVAVDAQFTFARPASHYRTGRNAHLLRDAAAPYPTGRGLGDLDKLLRACFDALTTAQVWADDVLVVQVAAGKAYGDEAGVMLTVRTDAVEPVTAVTP